MFPALSDRFSMTHSASRSFPVTTSFVGGSLSIATFSEPCFSSRCLFSDWDAFFYQRLRRFGGRIWTRSAPRPAPRAAGCVRLERSPLGGRHRPRRLSRLGERPIVRWSGGYASGRCWPISNPSLTSPTSATRPVPLWDASRASGGGLMRTVPSLPFTTRRRWDTRRLRIVFGLRFRCRNPLPWKMFWTESIWEKMREKRRWERGAGEENALLRIRKREKLWRP